MDSLERIASVATNTTRPSYQIITPNSPLDKLTDGTLFLDDSDILIRFRSANPIDFRNDPNETWVWQSRCPEREEFGDLRVFIMGGRIALVIWATRRDGKLHLERLTEFHSLSDIQYEPLARWLSLLH
jgi:hypothetical protein